jgi:LPXTG-motif cell wall-anchored protein
MYGFDPGTGSVAGAAGAAALGALPHTGAAFAAALLLGLCLLLGGLLLLRSPRTGGRHRSPAGRK